MRAARCVPAAGAIAMLLAAPAVRAGSFDVFGLGPEGIAEASARVARADDGTASYYNPGGLGLGSRYSVTAGAEMHLSLLEAGGQARPFSEPYSLFAAVDVDVPFEGPLEKRLRLGFGTSVLPASVLVIRSRAQTDPFFPYYDNRLDRLILLPSIGARATDWLGVGASANLLAGVTGPTEVREGASGGLETRVDQRAETAVAAILGVAVRPGRSFRLGLAWHQEFASKSRITATSNVGGIPLAVEGALAQAFFSPETWVLGVAMHPGSEVELEVDAAYARWSAWRGPLVRIDAELPGVVLRSREAPRLWRDVLTVRAGGNVRFGLGGADDLVVRLGAGFEPSTQRDVQQGATNMIDADKLIGAAGVTYELAGLARRPVRIGIGVQTHLLTPYSQEKRACTTPGACSSDEVFGPDAADPATGITNPGYPTLEGGGSVWALGIGIGVDL